MGGLRLSMENNSTASLISNYARRNIEIGKKKFKRNEIKSILTLICYMRTRVSMNESILIADLPHSSENQPFMPEEMPSPQTS